MTGEALVVLRSLMRHLLEKERTLEGSAASPGRILPGELSAQLRGLSVDALLAEIRRQRLVSLLASELTWLDADPHLKALAVGLRHLARRELRATLALQHLTVRVASLFEQAGLPMLVLKGIPLALQSAGSATARGCGDLDLLVPAEQLPAAVALLESAGFARPPGRFPCDLQSVWGRYSRWAGYELLLQRLGPVGQEIIDLHWSLAPVRQPLPGFAELWGRHQCFNLQGQMLRTLCRRDALLFAAVHAAKDDWHSLRHLVDLERLARLLSPDDREALGRHRLVRLSTAVAHACVGGAELLALGAPQRQDLAAALASCRSAQSQPLITPRAPGPWSLRRWLVMVARFAGLSRHPLDWLRIVLVYTLLPAAFNDPGSGDDRGLRGMVQARWRRWRQRRINGVSGSLPASARSAATPGP